MCAAIPANAYIGPGIGVGAITLVLGFIISVVVILLATIYFPIKKLLGKMKSGKRSHTKRLLRWAHKT